MCAMCAHMCEFGHVMNPPFQLPPTFTTLYLNFFKCVLQWGLRYNDTRWHLKGGHDGGGGGQPPPHPASPNTPHTPAALLHSDGDKHFRKEVRWESVSAPQEPHLLNPPLSRLDLGTEGLGAILICAPPLSALLSVTSSSCFLLLFKKDVTEISPGVTFPSVAALLIVCKNLICLSASP